MPRGIAMSEVRKRERLDGVQAARGAAAVFVLLYHGGRMLSLPQYVGWIPLGDVFEFGHAGVDFFFVLSGFIITYVHRADLGRPERLPHYAWRRLSRIVPMYWVVSALALLLAVDSLAKAAQLAPTHVLASFLFLPQGREPLLGVGWTLEHEMLFYVAFGIAVVWRRLGLLLAVIAGLLALAGPWLPRSIVLDYLACSYHVHFLLGILVALLVERGPVPAPRTIALAGAAAFLLAGAAEDTGLLAHAGYASQACFGLASAAVLTGLVAAERRGMLRVAPALVVVGAASYSIYLIHAIAIGVTSHALATAGIMKLLPGWGAMVLGVSAGLGAGLLLYQYVERPLTVALQRLKPGEQRPRPSLATESTAP